MFRKPPDVVLGEHKISVPTDIEDSLAAFNQLGFDAGL